MLDDIVVDTNVFCHASNPGAAEFDEARHFLSALSDSTTALCLDKGWDVDEGKNKSHIYHEYLERIPVGSVGRAVLTAILVASRVATTERRPEERIWKKITRCIRKKRDRTFLGVAACSNGLVLVTHDSEDFGAAKRAHIREISGVDILGAGDARGLL